MTIYIVHFIINMALGIPITLLPARDDGRAGKRLYLLMTFLQFGLVAGMRSDCVGYDTSRYTYIFNTAPSTFATILDHNPYIEVGFSIFCSIIKMLGGTAQTMFMASSLFVVGSACVFIYRHSKNVVLSVFILISFPFYYSSFDIIRHFMAVAFFLLGYKYVVERKFFKYVLFLAVGSTFHAISWLFLPFYFVRRLKWNAYTAIGAFGVTVFAYLFIDEIAERVANMLGKVVATGWIGDYGGGIKTAIMYLMILCVAVLGYNNLKVKSKDKACAVNHIMLLFMFSVIFINARMMTRLIMTSVPLMAISIPELLCDGENVKSRGNRAILIAAFVTIGVIYHAFMLMTNWQNVVPYVAYWQQIR